jgi:hypothetical protein
VITSSGACSNANTSVTMTSGTGTCALTATWAADNNYNAATASQSTIATRIAPTVTFTGAPPTAGYGSSFTVSATTNASTAAVITSSGSCSNSQNAVMMTSATGTCSLTATWPADANYNSATAAQSTTATKGTPTVTFTGAPASAVYHTSFTVTATTNASTSATIAASGVCSIASGGTNTATIMMTGGTGTCMLTASWAADSHYNRATARQSTAAAKASTTTSLSSTPNPSTKGQSVTFTATVVPAGQIAGTPTGTVTFESTAGKKYGTGTLTTGTATSSITSLPAGTDDIEGVYSGDSNFAASTSNTVDQVVNQ